MKSQQRIRKTNGVVEDREKLLKWFNRFLDRMPDGEVYLEFKDRSLSEAQRNYYFSQVSQLASYLGWTTDRLHKRLKLTLFPEDAVELGLTSIMQLDVTQMTKYIDACIQWCAEELDYQWEDPEQYKH